MEITRTYPDITYSSRVVSQEVADHTISTHPTWAAPTNTLDPSLFEQVHTRVSPEGMHITVRRQAPEGPFIFSNFAHSFSKLADIPFAKESTSITVSAEKLYILGVVTLLDEDGSEPNNGLRLFEYSLHTHSLREITFGSHLITTAVIKIHYTTRTLLLELQKRDHTVIASLGPAHTRTIDLKKRAEHCLLSPDGTHVLAMSKDSVCLYPLMTLLDPIKITIAGRQMSWTSNDQFRVVDTRDILYAYSLKGELLHSCPLDTTKIKATALIHDIMTPLVFESTTPDTNLECIPVTNIPCHNLVCLTKQHSSGTAYLIYDGSGGTLTKIGAWTGDATTGKVAKQALFPLPSGRFFLHSEMSAPPGKFGAHRIDLLVPGAVAVHHIRTICPTHFMTCSPLTNRSISIFTCAPPPTHDHRLHIEMHTLTET